MQRWENKSPLSFQSHDFTIHRAKEGQESIHTLAYEGTDCEGKYCFWYALCCIKYLVDIDCPEIISKYK